MELAELRIRVFAAFPYLYDGTREYEASYLKTYLEATEGIVVGAFDGDALIGAATGTPIEAHADEFGSALRDVDLDAGEIFYCAESVLLPAYRGHGIGRLLLERLAAIAVERDCGRLEWAVLDWNTPAIGFYRSLGAVPMDEWTTFRVTGEALTTLSRPRSS